MKIQPLLIALSLVNVALLTFSLARPVAADVQGIARVVRAHALEIVDDRGRVRASISVIPADPTFRAPGGATGSPEAVLVRLISSRGRPNVKIEASDFGSAMGIYGESDPTNVLISARRTDASVTVTDKGGRERVVTP